MRPDLQLAMQQFASLQSLDVPQVSRYSSADFKNGIQWLIGQDNLPLAMALADAGLSLHPQEEDILELAGFLAMSLENWPLAIEVFQDLRTVQQDDVQPKTYLMLARALYRNLELADAHQMLALGLAIWPQDASLQAEQKSMTMTEYVFPRTQHHN